VVVLVQYINSSEMLMRDVGGYSFLVHKKMYQVNFEDYMWNF